MDARHAALTAALYSMATSVVVAALCGWQLVVNGRHPHHLQDVYYGVQIAYLATLCTHLALSVLSCFLIMGIYQGGFRDHSGHNITKPRKCRPTPQRFPFLGLFYTLAFTMHNFCSRFPGLIDLPGSVFVPSFALQRFDTICKMEMSFLAARLLINILALWGVLKFHRNLRAGYTYRDPEAIEL
ncbi:hypothetical protein O3P69_003310 [Scylla paramamosain]|uniref:TLC domain-containing protein n=1 Tax=Scylla paramamosain TaxID=85552 RepID=A0AAW0UMV3_SCYPA